MNSCSLHVRYCLSRATLVKLHDKDVYSFSVQGSILTDHPPPLPLAHSDQEMVHSIVERLGQFHCVKTVCESTSHVVCGSPRRTVNVLSAILRGCWIVSLDWVRTHGIYKVYYHTKYLCQLGNKGFGIILRCLC